MASTGSERRDAGQTRQQAPKGTSSGPRNRENTDRETTGGSDGERRADGARRRSSDVEREQTNQTLTIAKELIHESAQVLGESEEITAEPGNSTLGTIPELSRMERREVLRRTAISAVVVHEAVREEGERELRRPPRALMWSALAAGALDGLLDGEPGFTGGGYAEYRVAAAGG
jgi:hypothetical protein